MGGTLNPGIYYIYTFCKYMYVYIPRASNAEFYFVVVNTMFYWVKHRTYGMLCFTLINITSFLHSHKCRCWLKSCKHYEAGPEKEPGAQTLEMLARLKPIPKNGSFFLCPGMHHGGSHCFAEGATRQQPCKMIQGSQHFTTIQSIVRKHS